MSTCWEQLPTATRAAVGAHVGAVHAARPVADGSASPLRIVLDADAGRVFCKGLPVDHRLAWMHRTEARLNPVLPAAIVPRLRWQIECGGWLLLGFDHVDGRYPDLSVGSTDLPAVAATLTTLAGALTPPPVPVRRLADRWAGYLDPRHIAGETLLHTDVSPRNFLLNTAMHVVDWATPAVGAAWVDTAFMVIRLVHAGHSPAQAERWASGLPAWAQAPAGSVTAFAEAVLRLWGDRQQAAAAAHRGPLIAAVRGWLGYRLGSCRTNGGLHDR